MALTGPGVGLELPRHIKSRQVDCARSLDHTTDYKSVLADPPARLIERYTKCVEWSGWGGRREEEGDGEKSRAINN
jgi:hypothetical protein